MKPGLYLHFPFCKRECFYCHFRKQTYDPQLAEHYIDALLREIAIGRQKELPLDTVYFGGGSPALLPVEQLMRVRDALYGNFSIDPDAEFTIEVNPEDVTRQKLKELSALGINRLSIGTQSFVDAHLHYLKRTHDGKGSVQAVQTALDCGFDNINVDFIIGLPNQSTESITQSLATLEQYPVPHVSAYILEGVEPKTDDETMETLVQRHYFHTVKRLGELGYKHYEVSNFHKPGKPSRHNLKYWHNIDYIGLGLSASGYLGNTDYKNTEDFATYFKKVAAGETPVDEATQNDPNLRRIIVGLRLMDGIPARYFSPFREQTDFLLQNNLLIKKQDNIAVNPAKILLLNEILQYFI